MLIKNVNVPYIQTSQDVIFKSKLFKIADALHNYLYSGKHFVPIYDKLMKPIEFISLKLKIVLLQHQNYDYCLKAKEKLLFYIGVL